MSKTNTKAEIMASPAVSYWVKSALPALDTRDACDVLNDLGLLTAYFEREFERNTRQQSPSCR